MSPLGIVSNRTKQCTLETMKECLKSIDVDFLTIYIFGIVCVGLPMALVSLYLYLLECRLDNSGWKNMCGRWIRNFLFPFSFLLDQERGPKSNWSTNYNGLIDMLDLDCEYGNYGGRRVLYVVLSSMFWPVRLFISLFVTAITIGLSGVCIVIFGPVWLLFVQIGRLFEKKERW